MLWGEKLWAIETPLRTEHILTLGVLVGARATLVGAGLALLGLGGYVRGEISSTVLSVDQMR